MSVTEDTTPRTRATGGPAVRRPGAARSRRRPVYGQENRAGYTFLLPWMLGFIGLTAGPMIASLWLSFTEYNLAAGSHELLGELVTAAKLAGRRARVHVKLDTGLGRAGCPRAEWAGLLEAAARAQADGAIEVAGVWSHFARSDDVGHESIDAQLDAFRDGLALAERLGLRPRWRHIANSAAILTRPDAHFDLVRAGIAMYGLSPVPGTAFGLRPAMTVRARVVIAKRAPAGQGVSYGHTYTTSGPTTLAVVPLGYADGVPRAASNVAPVRLAGRNRTIAGRVCMDQFVVDCGDDEVHAGDVAVLFGPGDAGEPTADDWAAATGTINYEIVTRMSTARVPRTYAGATPDTAGGTAAPEGEARR